MLLGCLTIDEEIRRLNPSSFTVFSRQEPALVNIADMNDMAASILDNIRLSTCSTNIYPSLFRFFCLLGVCLAFLVNAAVPIGDPARRITA